APTARGSAHASHYAMGDVAFSSAERDRHLGSRPVSQLDTWPVVAPVNASRRPSRDAAHHSGSGWLARPSPWGTCTAYSLPANWRAPLWANMREIKLKQREGGSWLLSPHPSPSRRNARTRLLPWVHDGEALVRIRVKDTRLGEPVGGQSLHSLP